MGPQFTAEFFRQNRERLRTLFTGTAPIVLTANGVLQRNGDNEFAFRQDSSFWYFSGVDEPDVILVLDKTKEYLILPARDAVDEAFYGVLEAEKLASRSGIAEVLDEKTGWKRLSHRLKKVQHIATLAAAPSYIERFGLYTNPARARLLTRMKEENSEAELLDLRPHLVRMRAVKQSLELEAIQRAIDITVDTLKNVRRKLPKYEFEYQIEADISHGFRTKGALGNAFSPIVASGKNACTLHYQANSAALKGARSLYLDVGAEYEHYAADITRTYFLGEPTKRAQKIFDTVAEVHAFALGLLKPGVIIKDYEKQVEQFMGEKLRELGLIKLAEKAEIRKFFPHATSHSLGLDPHDLADYERPLEAGMVVTVEPGIYVPEESIGVRIEDDVLITSGGTDVLSKKLPIA
jgi:Xaa-Pro aminopeptidase